MSRERIPRLGEFAFALLFPQPRAAGEEPDSSCCYQESKRAPSIPMITASMKVVPRKATFVL